MSLFFYSWPSPQFQVFMSNQKEFYLCATMIIAIKSEKKIKDMREKKEKYDAAPWAKKKNLPKIILARDACAIEKDLEANRVTIDGHPG